MLPRPYLFSLETFGIKLGLANIRALCSALGEPQAAFRSVLVAGTNGKGSVAAMVDRGLRAAGLTIGRYTSPHLVRLEERFAIDGVPVDTAALDAAIERTRETIERLLAAGTLDAPPTFFEATTAIAFDLFARAGVDAAVLEVGLGGRLDSTNCVEPVVSVITSIAFDHEQHLGHTLGAIAAEKAGIVRSGVPTIVGPLDPEARGVIASICATVGAPLLDAQEQVDVSAATIGPDGKTTIALKTQTADYGAITLGLRGAHQIPNAIVALRVLEELGRFFPVTRAAIVTALGDVEWPGRLQMVHADDGRRVLLDAAHNPAGASALAAYVRQALPVAPPLVFGAMRDKDVAGMLSALLPAVSDVIVTEPRNSRTWPAAEIAALARTLAPERLVETVTDPMAALERAWAQAPLACAAGSIFLVGELLAGLAPASGNR